ncbi:serine/arginine repetitive matrix protein 2-like [Sitodiplosis mosellana]|uniref:serine/arginine repetitive matrix protein 2-like n=1 Tax=Sitodiplosis mosellana TaxID=263140 RepID=UPI0024446D82|nr:serine/arginine repetitive matrix protein 2-like [Sitodiplosis mosellana]
MYNGIGLTTARGSGTNGHVQRNLSFVRQGKKDNVKYKNEAELSQAEAINNRGPNEEILEHERKRKIEVKVLEFEEILEEQDYTPEEIAAKVQAFREKLLGEIQNEQLPKDEFGRYAVRETHQLAAAKQEKNAMLRSAFGISEYFVEGSSFDADRKAKEELAKSAALQKELEAQRNLESAKSKQYKLVRTPSRERELVNEEPKGKSIEENKGKFSGEKSKKRKKSDKSNDRRDKKKRKADTIDSSSSSSENDSPPKKSRRKRKHSSSSDSSDDSSNSDSEPSKKEKRRGGQNKEKKKRSDDHTKKSKKQRRHSTSSSSSDSDSSSSSSSASSSSSSSGTGSDSHQKRKNRRK